MSEPQNKRKKPNYYIHKRRKQYILEPGLKGFLCTCNFREKECVREAYNILNLYADQLKSATTAKIDNKTVLTKENQRAEAEAEESDSDDIADELSKEITAFQNEKPTQKRFQVVESGAKNLLFVRTTVNNPTEIVSAIINDILTNKEQKTRFLLRLIPIQSTCKANMDEINKAVTALVEEHFPEPRTFAVAFNHRNNQQIIRDDVIKDIATIISTKNSNNKVDLKNPDVTIIVEVIRGMCLLSIIPDYNKFKKYNLLQLFESVSKTDKPSETDENKTEADATAISGENEENK